MGSRPVKKGRHRRFEEARALKRSTDFDAEQLFESLQKETGSDASTPRGGDIGEDDDLEDVDDDDN